MRLLALLAALALIGCAAKGPRIRTPRPGHVPCREPVPTRLSPRHDG